MFIPESKIYKPNAAALPELLEDDEVALAMVQIGLNSKVLTNRRLLFLDTFDSKIKEFIDLAKVESFTFGTFAGTPRVDALMRDGSTVKIGTLDLKWLDDVKQIFFDAIGQGTSDSPEVPTAVEPIQSEPQPPVGEVQKTVRTNSQKAFPKWLQASIHNHKRDDEELLMVITEPHTNHQGALLVFEDRCMIVKGGFVGGFMAGSLGGERAGTFYLNQITGIEYNSGMINGVLEILTPSYQGTANKDFWRASNKSRNADKNDPWTLSNCLPLTKDGYNSARSMIDELKKMVSLAQVPKFLQATPATSISDELTKLADLHSKGLLTDEEFQSAKSKLLG
jgi:hypothetical protein